MSEGGEELVLCGVDDEGGFDLDGSGFPAVGDGLGLAGEFFADEEVVVFGFDGGECVARLQVLEM